MMTASSTPVVKNLLILFLVIAGLYFAKSFLIPLAIGTVLATVFFPMCNWFEKKKVNRGFAAAICILVLLLMVAGIVSLVGWQIGELAKDFDLIKQKFQEALQHTQNYLLQNMGLSVDKQKEMLKGQQPALGSQVKAIAAAIPNMLTNIILTLIYLFLLLYYRSHIKQFFMKLSSLSERDETEKLIYSVAHVSKEYLIGLSKMILCLWVMYGIGFSAFGVKQAIFFAFLCGLLEIIPFIGNITGTSITLLVAAVQGASTPTLAGIAGVYILAQIIQGSVIQPLVVGSEVKINPLFTIIALVLGGLLWGMAGVFLAIPLMAMVKITCDQIVPLKPYGFLIGELPSPKKNSNYFQKISKWMKKKLK